MSNPTESLQIAPEYSVPLLNLSAVRTRMDSLQRFLSESVDKNTIISEREMDLVSAGISAAIHQTIVNGAALLSSCSSSQIHAPPSAEKPWEKPPPGGNYNNTPQSNLKEEDKDDEIDSNCEIVELDAVELLAEHVHFCEICGKGFKRDANLRMHMRAHGNQYKTPEALAKPQSNNGNGCSGTASLKRRFSCPYEGCNRNKKHKKFRPLKSVICVKNHVKRSHCPKIYACNRCNKKSFSVVADLKSHLKHCGESRWKCSCGTSFSRKDKLFGHMSLFEGHMPAVEEEAVEKKGKSCGAVEDDDEDLIPDSGFDNGFFDGLILDGFGSIDSYSLQDMLNSPNINGWQ